MADVTNGPTKPEVFAYRVEELQPQGQFGH